MKPSFEVVQASSFCSHDSRCRAKHWRESSGLDLLEHGCCGHSQPLGKSSSSWQMQASPSSEQQSSRCSCIYTCKVLPTAEVLYEALEPTKFSTKFRDVHRISLRRAINRGPIVLISRNSFEYLDVPSKFSSKFFLSLRSSVFFRVWHGLRAALGYPLCPAGITAPTLPALVEGSKHMPVARLCRTTLVQVKVTVVRLFVVHMLATLAHT